MLTEDGFLVLADISGFTAFVAATELEHGAAVTGVLLETVMRRLSPLLEIQELEGDAVFAIGPDRIITDGSALPSLMESAFVAFMETRSRLAGDASCTCGACLETARLGLKLIAHHGRFVRQLVGGRSRVTGPDVVLAHRLLKTPAGGRGSLLLTGPALARIGIDPVVNGLHRYLVSDPHLGEVPCFVADLPTPGSLRLTDLDAHQRSEAAPRPPTLPLSRARGHAAVGGPRDDGEQPVGPGPSGPADAVMEHAE